VKATRQQKSQRLPPGVAGKQGNLFNKKLLAKFGKQRRTLFVGIHESRRLHLVVLSGGKI
jgi:hypothetical protein